MKLGARISILGLGLAAAFGTTALFACKGGPSPSSENDDTTDNNKPGTSSSSSSSSGGGSGSASSDTSEDVPSSGALQPPGPDGKCPAGQRPFFYKPGCNGEVKPLCTPDGPRHACIANHCGCDGVTFETFCHQTEKAYRSFGACEAIGDAGPDA
jgi:hypothetical protein